MSSELHKYIETAIDKKDNLLKAKVIKFPNDEIVNDHKDLTKKNYGYWKISDETNDDQLKAVLGICFMFGTLILIGLYSNLV
jgi:hypothetical protein|tara:strand:+ start:1488 stop:1733 length:246 start_codon:yes stop_codon:yes gene_type:complete